VALLQPPVVQRDTEHPDEQPDGHPQECEQCQDHDCLLERAELNVTQLRVLVVMLSG
jgi:hypothetical protein